jgi:ubiquitin C-terminal hydrolase
MTGGNTMNNLFKIKKVDIVNEKIRNCTSCNITSTSVNIESMYEITLPETKIYLCDDCFLRLERAFNNFK